MGVKMQELIKEIVASLGYVFDLEFDQELTDLVADYKGFDEVEYDDTYIGEMDVDEQKLYVLTEKLAWENRGLCLANEMMGNTEETCVLKPRCRDLKLVKYITALILTHRLSRFPGMTGKFAVLEGFRIVKRSARFEREQERRIMAEKIAQLATLSNLTKVVETMSILDELGDFEPGEGSDQERY